MKNFSKKLRRFLSSEDGATAVEYAVMVALIIAVCIGAITTIGSKSNVAFSNVGAAM